jgi:hypothetical protein
LAAALATPSGARRGSIRSTRRIQAADDFALRQAAQGRWMPWHGAALRVRLAISGEAFFEQFVELESVAHGPRLERKHEIEQKTRPRL